MNEPIRSVPLTGKILLLIGIGGILFACGFCLGAAVTAILTRPEPFIPSSSGPAGSSLDHPAPPDTVVRAGDLEIQVIGTVRPADEIVAEGGVINPRPGPGNEMMLVTVSITCRPAEDVETCAFVPVMEFLLVSPIGVHRPEWLVVGLPDPLEGGEVQAGETVSGDMVFEVGEQAGGLVLVYSEIFGGEVAYLGIPSGNTD